MWKKNESESDPDATVESAPRPKAAASSPSPARPRSQPATIGPSISIKGDISGDEDLLIEGRVEGAIQLRQNDVTVGTSGRVVADIHGKRICVDGEVTGDLMGDEVLIRKSGRVEGNAKAPRVMLENGCHFRGSIDMKPANDAPATVRSAPVQPPARRNVS
ncbi:MAG: polymer-forming cytoskeletal protein [bacterium]|nr:polymer-forming cytoskeletal protein [bacterium]